MLCRSFCRASPGLVEFTELHGRPYRLIHVFGLQVVKLAQDIATAMVFLHKTVVHRDLKPQNILLSPSGSDSHMTAKVADFGISQFKDRCSSLLASCREYVVC